MLGHRCFGAGHAEKETRRKQGSWTEVYDTTSADKAVGAFALRPSYRKCLQVEVSSAIQAQSKDSVRVAKKRGLLHKARYIGCPGEYSPAEVYPLVAPGVL